MNISISSRIKLFLSFILVAQLLSISGSLYSQSGDVVIDGWLSGFALKTGSKLPPTTIHPSNYPNGVDKCNSGAAPAHEANCPSDLFYTPNENTGGYQAFGIGATAYQGGTYVYPDCYYYFVWNGDYWEPYITCNYLAVSIPDHTFGAAAGRIKFGIDTTLTNSWGPKPMSTLAFKGNNIYSPTDLSVICPTFFNGNTAPCNALYSDVYTVEDPGYEDKIIIPDYDCSIIRTGTGTDANYNCFTHAQMNWWSDLPGAYIDTTFTDTGANYVPAMGSVVPQTFVEGATYGWWVNFYQWGFESGSSYVFLHNSAVTQRKSVGGVNCNQDPELCYFNVDQTTIAPSLPYP